MKWQGNRCDICLIHLPQLNLISISCAALNGMVLYFYFALVKLEKVAPGNRQSDMNKGLLQNY